MTAGSALNATRSLHPTTGGGGGKSSGSSGGKDDSSGSGSTADRERDPFGFRELKARHKRGAEASGPDFPPVTAEDAAAVEETLARTGRVPVGRNVFGVEGVTREMAEAWEAGVLPPQLPAQDTDQLINRSMYVRARLACLPTAAATRWLTHTLHPIPTLCRREGPEDLYWPTHLDTSLPREEDQLYDAGHDKVYSPEEMKVRGLCGVCRVVEGRCLISRISLPTGDGPGGGGRRVRGAQAAAWEPAAALPQGGPGGGGLLGACAV